MKGATFGINTLTVVDSNFNPRTHEGCDLIVTVKSRHNTNFNPRTHEGCDSLQINSVIACFSIIYIAN